MINSYKLTPVLFLTFTIAVVCLPVTLANAAPPSSGNTQVKGTIKDSSGNNVSNATVQVVCNGSLRGATTNGAGLYQVDYTFEECDDPDSLQASATSPNGSGSQSGTVQSYLIINNNRLNVAGVNLTLTTITVPEMGSIGSLVAMTAGIAGFIYLRSKQVVPVKL